MLNYQRVPDSFRLHLRPKFWDSLAERRETMLSPGWCGANLDAAAAKHSRAQFFALKSGYINSISYQSIQYHNSCAFMRHISYVIHIQVEKSSSPSQSAHVCAPEPAEGRNSSNVAPTWPFFLSDLGYREYGMQNESHVVSHLKYYDIYGGFLKWDPKSPWIKLY
jgi:hypothetical protein